ncbi:MAG: hypothetical protein R3F17_04875 [Planctomycetota bacterium]
MDSGFWSCCLQPERALEGSAWSKLPESRPLTGTEPSISSARTAMRCIPWRWRFSEEDRLIYKSRVQHGLSEAETHCDLDLRPYGLQFLEALAATGKGTAGLNDEQIAKLQSANRVETIQVLGKHRSAIHNLTMEVLDEEDPEQVRLKEFRRKLEGLGYVFWT